MNILYTVIELCIQKVIKFLGKFVEIMEDLTSNIQSSIVAKNKIFRLNNGKCRKKSVKFSQHHPKLSSKLSLKLNQTICLYLLRIVWGISENYLNKIILNKIVSILQKEL